MSEESKVTQADIMEQLQAGHRARVDGSMLQNFNKDAVQFREVVPNRSAQQAQPMQMPEPPQPGVPESYLNYAAQLLEQMRGVYASSWDSSGSNCSSSCDGSWHGGHNHFFDPCSGADVAPTPSCPPFDCSKPVCCNEHHHHHPKPQPPSCSTPSWSDCSCGTTTYYDDWGFKLQQLCDQLNRIEGMTKDILMTHQQLFSYLVECCNTCMSGGESSGSSSGNH